MGQNFSSEPVVEKDTEKDQNELFNVAVSSCQGWRTSQEDNHSMVLDLPGPHKASLFAVYDGHGSARVSKHASESLWKHLTENEAYKKGDFKQALETAFLTFDREVNESYNAQLAGTTAVCILIVDNIVYCANIGDSRSVASVDCECVPLSHDHKPENPTELKRILAAGGYVLGNRVNGNLALSRAFGDFHYKGNDQLPPDQQIVSPCPDIQSIELNDDLDFIVIACDGIWDVLSSEDVVRFVINRLERNIEPATICEQLTTRCLATDYELVIGCDNMTVLLVCYTRGRSWDEYCTDIFNKQTKKLGGNPRTRIFGTDNLDQLDHLTTRQYNSQQSSQNLSQEEEQINSNNLSHDLSGDDSTGQRASGDATSRALLNMFESLGLGRLDQRLDHLLEEQTPTDLHYSRGNDEDDDSGDDRCRIVEVVDNEHNDEDTYRCRIEEVKDDDDEEDDSRCKIKEAKDDDSSTSKVDNTNDLVGEASDRCRIEEVKDDTDVCKVEEEGDKDTNAVVVEDGKDDETTNSNTDQTSNQETSDDNPQDTEISEENQSCNQESSEVPDPESIVPIESIEDYVKEQEAESGDGEEEEEEKEIEGEESSTNEEQTQGTE